MGEAQTTIIIWNLNRRSYWKQMLTTWILWQITKAK